MIASIFELFPWYVWAALLLAAVAFAIFAPAAKVVNAALGICPPLVWAIMLVFAAGTAGVEKSQLSDLREEVKTTTDALQVKKLAELPKKFTDLTTERDKFKDDIGAMNAAAETEKSKQLKEANEKTLKYNAVVKQNREYYAKLNAAILSRTELDNRLRNITEQSGGGATCTGDSGFTRRLGTAYAQCEQDLSESIESARRANENLGKAVAAIRALKN